MREPSHKFKLKAQQDLGCNPELLSFAYNLMAYQEDTTDVNG